MNNAEWFQPQRPTLLDNKRSLLRRGAKRRWRWMPLEARAELPRPKSGEKKIGQREVRRRLSQIKLERGCMDCGYRAHPAALDFDHARGRKSVNLAAASIPYWSVVEHEIAKCDVVCANCHRIRTVKRCRKGARS